MNYNKVGREVKRIYKEVDVRMKYLPKVCSKGCAHCCRQLIPVHAFEEFAITRFAKECLGQSVQNKIKNNLNSWLDFFDATTPNNKILEKEDMKLLGEAHIANKIECPFLIDDTCFIYEVRPLACRAFSVNDDPDLCKKMPDRLGDEQGYKIKDLALLEICRISDLLQLRLLPYAVAHQFGIVRKFKPIENEAYYLLKR